jgi:serine/threonine-protein kinase HipA
MTDRSLFVYVDIDSKPFLVGRLWARERRGRETASFAYDESWLASHERFALEPALTLGAGEYHTPVEKALFGALGDSAPDRWGRNLMRRAERRRAGKEGRPPRTLLEIDYLLGVDDETRLGALRFAERAGGPFLASEAATRVPPLVELPRLLSATERIANNDDDDEDIRLLLAPGSSLGGARPKASVRDRDRSLAIAKFPHKDDDIPIVLWEAVALRLAAKAGIPVPEARIEQIAGKPVLILRRFDRSGEQRLPFLSAMSMIGAGDNEAHSYLEIADALRQYGAAPAEDLAGLWRRVLFSILISNTDDHLRNHGFLYVRGGGWRLSPAYDLNPVPTDIKARVLTLAIDEEDTTASFEIAIETAPYYGLTRGQAQAIASEVAVAVSDWRQEAARASLSSNQIERMSSAFEHADLDKASGSPK